MLKLLIDVQRKTVITQAAQCDEKQPTHIFENLFSSCRHFTIVDLYIVFRKQKCNYINGVITLKGSCTLLYKFLHHEPSNCALLPSACFRASLIMASYDYYAFDVFLSTKTNEALRLYHIAWK